MKTKLTFLSFVIAALFGVGMLMAFKQSDSSKKYLSIYYQTGSKTALITDENNQPIAVNITRSDADIFMMTKLINEYSEKGYKLVSFSSSTHDNVMGNMNSTSTQQTDKYYAFLEKN